MGKSMKNMGKSMKIVLVPQWGDYRVKQVVNTLVHEPGDMLRKDQLRNFIASGQYTVVVQEK